MLFDFRSEIKKRKITFTNKKFEPENPVKLAMFSLILSALFTVGATAMEPRSCPQKAELESIPEIELTLEPAAPVVSENIVEVPKPVVIQAPVSAPEKKYVFYKVDLSEELQRYTQDVCEEYGVSYPLAIAIMYHESRFQPDVVSKTGDYGIMQINKGNHEWLETELGVTDWFDPYQNIKAGVYILSLNSQYDDLHKVVMCYNYGPTGAKRCWDKGIYTSEYSRMIMDTIENLVEA